MMLSETPEFILMPFSLLDSAVETAFFLLSLMQDCSAY